MNCINVMAGEVLDPGDMVHLAQDRAYKVCDADHIPRGVVSKHYEVGDVVDSCIVSPGIIEKLRSPDGYIGTAGEDLIEGGAIELHSNGQWYNRKDHGIKGDTTK